MTSKINYLQSYSEELQHQATEMIKNGQAEKYILQKYPQAHSYRSDKALAQFVRDLKQCHLKKASALSKIVFDTKITLEKGALGLHTFRSKAHGRKTKSSNEIRIAALFKNCPEEFLIMIVVHELAHLREKEHNKPFYKLCQHMEPNYFQYEFDLRLYLTYLSTGNSLY